MVKEKVKNIIHSNHGKVRLTSLFWAQQRGGLEVKYQLRMKIVAVCWFVGPGW
jgi:hypothetical protein